MWIYAFYGFTTLMTVIWSRNQWVGAVFFTFATLVVAFRFETGFDWPIYKAMFAIAGDARLLDVAAYRSIYSGEPAFVIFLGALAKTGASYEFIQFIFSIFFFAALTCIGMRFSRERLFGFLALALSYLVFTVGFSTVRQAIAISFFLLALLLMEKRRWLGAAAMLLSALFHSSAALYIFSYLLCGFSIRFDQGSGVRTAFLIFLLSSGALAGLFLAAHFSMLPAGERIDHYVAGLRAYNFSLWDVMFGAAFLGMALHVIVSEAVIENSDNATARFFLGRMVVVLAVASIVSLAVPIIRERMSYLLWIMYSLFVMQENVLFRRAAASFAVAFGLFFTAIAHLRYPNSLMFLPYQNSVVDLPAGDRSGSERYNEFIIEHNKLIGIH